MREEGVVRPADAVQRNVVAAGTATDWKMARHRQAIPPMTGTAGNHGALNGAWGRRQVAQGRRRRRP